LRQRQGENPLLPHCQQGHRRTFGQSLRALYHAVGPGVQFRFRHRPLPHDPRTVDEASVHAVRRLTAGGARRGSRASHSGFERRRSASGRRSEGWRGIRSRVTKPSAVEPVRQRDMVGGATATWHARSRRRACIVALSASVIKAAYSYQRSSLIVQVS